MTWFRETPLALVALLAACGPGKIADAQSKAPVAGPPPAAAAARWTWTPIKVDMGGSGYCPTPTPYQLPGQPDLFLGRTADKPQCLGPTAYTIGLFKMDWSTNTLHFVKPLMDVPATTPSGLTVKAALDPAAVLYRGEIWVSFVCVAGFGDNSSCVAPLDLQTGQIELSRLTVPMRGVKSPFSEERFSAGVPKLFVYGDHIYMYSSVVQHMPRTAEGRAVRFGGVTARGIELEEKGDLMRAAGAPGGHVNSTDTANSHVLPLKPGDPTADVTADIFDVKQIDGRTLVTVAVGGSGSGSDEDRCMIPIAQSHGCYRLEINQGSAPLGLGVFDRTISTAADLPANPANYAHFITLPSGRTALIVWFFRPRPQEDQQNTVNPGLGILTTPILQ